MMMNRRDLLCAASTIAAAGLMPRTSFAQSTPVQGGTLGVHFPYEQRILNPAVRAAPSVYLSGGKIVESLVDLGNGGEILPVLASSWDAAADGKTYTFTLRDGVKWHDGAAFTSADVQFTAMEIWKKHQNFGTTLQQNLESVEAPDARTAVFRYSSPMPESLLMRALCDLGYIAPKHLFEGKDILENPVNNAPIGTGPFKFVEYQRGRYILMERNEDYWQSGKPYLDKVICHVIVDGAAATAALETGTVQLSSYSSLPLADIDRLSRDERFEVSTKGAEGSSFNNTLEFNTRRKELADVRVRRAIAHAIDVPFFIENFLYGMGKVATGPIPSTSPFYPENAAPYPFDAAKAEALLDEAGYPRGSDGVRFSMRLLPIIYGEDIPLLATYIQQCLDRVGIRIEIVKLDVAAAIKAVYTDWDFDLVTAWHQFRGDPAISTTVWFRSGAPRGLGWSNQYGWKSEAADALIDQANSELDVAKRKALYEELVAALNEEIPVLMLTERYNYSVTSKQVQNHHTTPRWDAGTWADTWMTA